MIFNIFPLKFVALLIMHSHCAKFYFEVASSLSIN